MKDYRSALNFDALWNVRIRVWESICFRLRMWKKASVSSYTDMDAWAYTIRFRSFGRAIAKSWESWTRRQMNWQA